MNSSYLAFSDAQCIARGVLPDLALQVWRYAQDYPQANVLVFEQESSQRLELDVRGSAAEVFARYRAQPQTPAVATVGRPKLGVVAREVTLLPRHWEWLASQPGGASVTLRKLVEEAKRKSEPADKIRLAQEAVYRFISVLAGDYVGYEEALRALYAADAHTFGNKVQHWPADVREHALYLAKNALDF